MTPKNNDSLESLKTNITSDESSDGGKDNSVLQKLLNSKIGSSGNIPQKKKATADDEPVSNMQKVVATRYKIYTFLILILGWIVWSSFLSTAINRNDFTKQTVENNELKVTHLTNKLSTYQRDQKFVALIEEQENSDAIYQCVNNEIDCDKLPENILKQIDLVKAYLQIGNLYDRKMVIDEKSLLINLDAYMTKERRAGFPTDRSNGEILELLIGDPEQIDQQLYQVPLDVQIEFDDKDALLSFINNVENRIIKGIDASTVRSTPVFYKINQIEYDIVNYTEEQNVIINMTAYYYQEEREELVVEEVEEEEQTDTTTASLTVEESNNSDTSDNNTEDSTTEEEAEIADETDEEEKTEENDTPGETDTSTGVDSEAEETNDTDNNTGVEITTEAETQDAPERETNEG